MDTGLVLVPRYNHRQHVEKQLKLKLRSLLLSKRLSQEGSWAAGTPLSPPLSPLTPALPVLGPVHCLLSTHRQLQSQGKWGKGEAAPPACLHAAFPFKNFPFLLAFINCTHVSYSYIILIIKGKKAHHGHSMFHTVT